MKKTTLWIFWPLVLIAATAHADYSVSVKDFREIFASLVLSTGVDPTDQDLNNLYTQVSGRLPSSGSVDQVTAPEALAFTGLAALFCAKLITADSALPQGSQRRAHTNVDFTQGPAALTADIRTQVLDAYSGLFWSRSPSTDEFTELNSLMSDVAPNLGATAADTVTLLTVACTAVAGSLDDMVN